MESREFSRGKPLITKFIEQWKRLINHLLHLLKKNDEWKSNLTEKYIVYKEYSDEDFVKEFLANRKRLLHYCHFELKITEKPKDATSNIIGEAILSRKRKEIARATLCTKECDGNEKIIYWMFNK